MLYKGLSQTYERNIPLIAFCSLRVRCVYASFVKVWFQKFCLGYWELQNILQLPLLFPQLYDFLKDIHIETLENLPISFSFFNYFIFYFILLLHYCYFIFNLSLIYCHVDIFDNIISLLLLLLLLILLLLLFIFLYIYIVTDLLSISLFFWWDIEEWMQYYCDYQSLI